MKTAEQTALIELAQLVSNMRTAQREFFRTRSIGWLETSRGLERQVDRELAKILELQQELF